MEAADSTQLGGNLPGKTPKERLSELFGSYKAEWLRESIFDLFTEPDYFPELATNHPCVLIGGRGTGKTTVLRSLSYEGRFALSGRNATAIPNWPFYGFYYRVNTNRVTAFSGPELTDAEWTRFFGHYVNLLLCLQAARFLDWYSGYFPTSEGLDQTACNRIAKSLGIPSATSTAELLAGLDTLRIEIEAVVNNLQSRKLPFISMQAAPIDEMIAAINELPQFAGKGFFFLIDEYENFLDYQQTVINTLIKHSGQRYSFKIGVKELGWRRRATLNANEHLISPADYIRINISEKLSGDRFEAFAQKVCEKRLSPLGKEFPGTITAIRQLLPSISEDNEADLLGVHDVIADVRRAVAGKTVATQLSALELYFIKFWSQSQRQSIETTLFEMEADESRWRWRFNNYKHALLFTIRRKKSGIRKYYCGWDVFVQLAANNIRYLLELVDQSLLLQLSEGGNLEAALSPAVQTRAAQGVGRKNLTELEGLSVDGAQLTKLLLGLGRIFQVMASEAEGHTPETTQFYIVDSADTAPDGLKLLNAAVMHLALMRSPGNKLADEADTMAYDYWVHPIFTPFFVFSYRKKRKMALSTRDVTGLVTAPRESIRSILRKVNRSGDETLPEQLLLFEGYYGVNAGP